MTAFTDGTLNVIVSLSKGNRTNFTPHRFHAIDDTLTRFSEGTLRWRD